MCRFCCLRHKRHSKNIDLKNQHYIDPQNFGLSLRHNTFNRQPEYLKLSDRLVFSVDLKSIQKKRGKTLKICFGSRKG